MLSVACVCVCVHVCVVCVCVNGKPFNLPHHQLVVQPVCTRNTLMILFCVANMLYNTSEMICTNCPDILSGQYTLYIFDQMLRRT